MKDTNKLKTWIEARIAKSEKIMDPYEIGVTQNFKSVLNKIKEIENEEACVSLVEAGY